MTVQLDERRIGRTIDVQAKQHAMKEANKADYENQDIVYEEQFNSKRDELLAEANYELLSSMKASSINVSPETENAIVIRYSVKEDATLDECNLCLEKYSEHLSSEDFAFSRDDADVEDILEECFEVFAVSFRDASRNFDLHRTPQDAIDYKFPVEVEINKEPDIFEPKIEITSDVLRVQMEKKSYDSKSLARKLNVSKQEVEAWLIDGVSYDKTKDVIEALRNGD